MRATTATIVLTILCLSACAYMESLAKQNKLRHSQKMQPSQYVEKHIIERDFFFVYGKLVGGAHQANSLAVAAISTQQGLAELVDINYLGKVNSYFGLNLPEGQYRLIVLSDANRDAKFTQNEVVAERRLTISHIVYPEGVARDIDIPLVNTPMVFENTFSIPVAKFYPLQQSLFFPKGTLRTLDDPLFSAQMANMGLYDPGVFMENAPMLFYALEEQTIHKIPVIFVHGIGGSVTQFREMIASLDRERYKAWFFYYPSGVDLNNSATMFYDIFLSGKLLSKELVPPIIIAHSMGGLVVREALNLYRHRQKEIHPALVISIASPYGGMASAQAGVDRAPLVLPAWNDLTPNSAFIKNLNRKSLPEATHYYWLYAYKHDGGWSDSDGVVPVSSQLPESLRHQVKEVFGFKTTHTGILKNTQAIATVNRLLLEVPGIFPEEHLKQFSEGGFEVALGNRYSEEEKYIIQCMGKYLAALANGTITPIAINNDFLAVLRGEKKARSSFETAWQKFSADFPELANAAGCD